MLSWVIWAAGQAGWYFFAWGPQLLICLYLGYRSAKKTGGDLLDWVVAAFLASLIPIGGVVIMLAVWWRAGSGGHGSPHAGAPPPVDGGQTDAHSGLADGDAPSREQPAGGAEASS